MSVSTIVASAAACDGTADRTFMSCERRPWESVPDRRSARLFAALARGNRLAERLKQRPVHRVALRVVLRVPLHAERKARRLGDPDRLDRAVVGHTLHHHPLAEIKNALAVQRI